MREDFMRLKIVRLAVITMIGIALFYLGCWMVDTYDSPKCEQWYSFPNCCMGLVMCVAGVFIPTAGAVFFDQL
jgi:hypothetical protein